METVEQPRRSIAPRETRDQAVRRLATVAIEKGIAIYTYDLGKSIEYFATSASRVGTLHRVTAFSCDCPAFVTHQRCCHHSRLLDVIGELPDPDPIEESARQRRQGEIRTARAEVMRLRGFAKTTADFRRLEDAKTRLLALVEADRGLTHAASPVALAA